MADRGNPNGIPRFIKYLSLMLQTVAEMNDINSQNHPQKISVFHGVARPSISIQSYMERIFKYANCCPSCFIVAYIYLHRFTQKQPSLFINSFNIHRLLITSVMVAAKFMGDMRYYPYNNAYYARIGGVRTREMNSLERNFLDGVGFNLFVTRDTFEACCSYLNRKMMMLEPLLNLRESNLSLERSLEYLHIDEDESSG